MESWCSKVLNELASVAGKKQLTLSEETQSQPLSRLRSVAILGFMATSILIRRFEIGLSYFRENKFHKYFSVRLAWKWCFEDYWQLLSQGKNCFESVSFHLLLFICCHYLVFCFSFQKKDKDQQQMRQRKFHDKDSEVTVTDLWLTWWKGEVHNWWAADTPPLEPIS